MKWLLFLPLLSLWVAPVRAETLDENSESALRSIVGELRTQQSSPSISQACWDQLVYSPVHSFSLNRNPVIPTQDPGSQWNQSLDAYQTYAFSKLIVKPETPVPLSNGSETGVCGDAFQAICRTPDISQEDQNRKALLSKLKSVALRQAALPVSQGGCASREIDSTCYARELEKQILSASQLTPDEIKRFVTSIKANMISTLDQDADLDSALREQMKSVIRKIKIYTLSNLAEIVPYSDDAKGILNSEFGCGADLTAINAFSIDSWKESLLANDEATKHRTHIRRTVYPLHPMVFCPAAFLTTAPVGDPDRFANIYHIVAHEMGHQIDATRKLNYETEHHTEWALDRSRLSRPRKFLDVTTDWVGPEGSPITDPAQFMDYTPAYAKFRSCFKKNYTPNLIFGPENVDQSTDSQDLENSFRRAYGPDLDSVDSHLAELNGDYWGTRFLAKKLAESRKDLPGKIAIIRKAIPQFCDSPAIDPEIQKSFDTHILGVDNDGGMHPSDRFRVMMILKNPVIRQAMGCQPLPAQIAPFCGLNGEERAAY